jgi:hypothetical protein
MISIEFLKPTNEMQLEEVEINLDAEGLESLLKQLEFLKSGRTDHLHLMSESWGGNHLEDSPLKVGNMVVRHLKILLR